MIRGIDVSDWKPDIDWSAVAGAGYSFAIIKATQGTRNVQGTFAPYRQQAPAGGLGPIGLYHFAQDGDPAAQADHFCTTVGGLGPDEFAVLDIEANADYFTLPLSSWPAFIIAWCERVEAQLGGPVVVYMSESPAKSMPSAVGRWPLWVAGYQTRTPTEWEDWQVGPWSPAIWQWTDVANVPGVGSCDANVAPDDLRSRLGFQDKAPVAGLEHLHPVFADRVANACQARGTTVYSGARSTAEQAELYRRYQAGTGSPANPPGLSWHEYGPDLLGGSYALAVDFSEPYPHGEAGLIFPIAGEPWHGQPTEIPETARTAGADLRLPAPPTPKEPDVSKVAYPLSVLSGETRRLPILAIGGGFGWTKASVTYAADSVEVRRAIVGPNERPIAGLAPDGVETGRTFGGRGYVDLQPGDEWLMIELGASPAGTLDLYVEATDV
jgi:GH25 family lysozyme M1 (1,4-beta-N-acetylmuramidase)